MTTNIRYLYIVILVISFKCINYCQCSTSAKTQENNSRLNNAEHNIGQARLISGIDTITPVSNLLDDAPKLVYKGAPPTKTEYQYFHSPVLVTTPKYDIKSSGYYQKPIINHSFLPPTPHAPIKHLVVPRPTATHIVRVTESAPVWRNDLMRMENQYLDTFRSIQTSVMGFIYRVQDFVSYVVGFFAEGGKFVAKICWISRITTSND